MSPEVTSVRWHLPRERRSVVNKRIILLMSLALAVAACGGSGEPQTEASTAPLTKNAALPKTTTTMPQRPAPTTMAPRAAPTTTSRPTTAPTTKAPATTAAPTTTAPTITSAPASTAVANTCTAMGPCAVGQTGPAGGIVFYAAATPQRWGQYMEVRPQAFEQIVPDTCNLDAYASYSAGRIGDGITQTAAVIAACAKDGKPAAAGSYARVNAYAQNGFTGWFIPAKDELQALLDSKVVTFPTDQDLTSGTWANRPTAPDARAFDVLYGLKKEVLAGTAAYSRGGTVRNVEIMSDGTQSYGNPNNRWGWIYVARAFGPTA